MQYTAYTIMRQQQHGGTRELCVCAGANAAWTAGIRQIWPSARNVHVAHTHTAARTHTIAPHSHTNNAAANNSCECVRVRRWWPVTALLRQQRRWAIRWYVCTSLFIALTHLTHSLTLILSLLFRYFHTRCRRAAE